MTLFNQYHTWKKFAEEFLNGRIRLLEKDVRICLRPYRSKRYTNNVPRQAYFPALMACFATLEFMTGLNIGNLKNPVPQSGVKQYVKDYMDTTIYGKAVNILWKVFRHKIAHMAHPNYVTTYGDRRIVWMVSGKDIDNHMSIEKNQNRIKSLPKPPYPVPYNHRIYISIPRLKNDVARSIEEYLIDVKIDSAKLENFQKAVGHIYPR